MARRWQPFSLTACWMAWTALWRSGAELTDAGGFPPILRWIFSFSPPGAVRLYSGGSAEQCPGGRLAAVCLYRPGSGFLAFARPGGRAQIANPGYAHKSLYYLRGLTEGSEVILLLSSAAYFRRICLAGVAVWRAVLRLRRRAHLRWLPGLKAGNDHSVNGVSRVADKGRRAEAGRGY